MTSSKTKLCFTLENGFVHELSEHRFFDRGMCCAGVSVDDFDGSEARVDASIYAVED